MKITDSFPENPKFEPFNCKLEKMAHLEHDSTTSAPAGNPAEETQIQQRRATPDDFEQYALTAGRGGWYPCLHSRRINFYLKTDEVWKYGFGGSGAFGRFKATFLLKNNVSCIIQYRGSFAECLRQEQLRLFKYRNLPENLARPPAQQLPRPPYNPIVPFADVF